ncbi:hypothetical protein RZS08_59375, partial [Arthrospira platensis SPKY1]|nr:hypothetical protein [Arthrospira platensis SPKY1]
MLKVLRKQVGDEILATNGAGLMLRSKLVATPSKTAVFKVQEVVQLEKPQPTVAIFMGMLHQADRVAFALEKATELGVGEVHWIRSQTSQFKGEFK